MATIKDIKTKIQNANALGIANLTDKGVNVPETATTYEIMQSIADVSSGGGTEEIEDLIDNSGVLEDTEGSVSEKVEQLIEWLKFFTKDISGINMAFCKADETPIIDCINYTYLYNAFPQTRLKVIRLKNTQHITHWGYAFQGNSYLHTLETLDFSDNEGAHSGTVFSGCSALVNVKFVAESIKKSMTFAQSSVLSTESIQSIIDGLATVETAQTLTLHSAITLTDEQKATINAKGWTLAQ